MNEERMAEEGEREERSYHSPLRERQAARTGELIVQSLADVISEKGVGEFSIQEVAEKADVSPRTVYRHFPNRQALLDGLAERVQERMAQEDGRWINPPHSEMDTEEEWEVPPEAGPEDLLGVVPAVFARFDELAPLSTAMVLASSSGRLRARLHEGRTELFREYLSGALKGLPEDEADTLFSVCRHLISAQTWFVLREEFGLDGKTAGRAVVRTVRALLREVEEERPVADDEGPPEAE